jgi:hypothetical protein
VFASRVVSGEGETAVDVRVVDVWTTFVDL